MMHIILVMLNHVIISFAFFFWQTKVRQDYLPREKLDKYLTINPSSSLSSLVPRGMTEDEFTAEVTSKFKTVSLFVFLFFVFFVLFFF